MMSWTIVPAAPGYQVINVWPSGNEPRFYARDVIAWAIPSPAPDPLNSKQQIIDFPIPVAVEHTTILDDPDMHITRDITTGLITWGHSTYDTVDELLKDWDDYKGYGNDSTD